MSGVHRLVVLHGMAAGGDAPDLIGAAAAWAAQDELALDIIELASEGTASHSPDSLACPAHWWQCRAALGASPDAEGWLSAAVQAFAALRIPQEPVLLLLPHEPQAVELAARLAHRLGGACLGHCSSLALTAEGVVATRPAFGGAASLEIESRAALCTATWRPAPPITPSAMHTPVRHELALEGSWPDVPTVDLTPEPIPDAMAPLQGACVVVCGGRGMEGAEGFGLLGEIAALLGGSLGASLPAVDAGWLPVARQIGQSGKYVAPALYVAVGVSGTPQHLAGVAEHSRIVAINRDPDAPIFDVAEIGLVADWREVLPLIRDHLLSLRDEVR